MLTRRVHRVPAHRGPAHPGTTGVHLRRLNDDPPSCGSSSGEPGGEAARRLRHLEAGQPGPVPEHIDRRPGWQPWVRVAPVAADDVVSHNAAVSGWVQSWINAPARGTACVAPSTPQPGEPSGHGVTAVPAHRQVPGHLADPGREPSHRMTRSDPRAAEPPGAGRRCSRGGVDGGPGGLVELDRHHHAWQHNDVGHEQDGKTLVGHGVLAFGNLSDVHSTPRSPGPRCPLLSRKLL